jgi:hypothetical protein
MDVNEAIWIMCVFFTKMHVIDKIEELGRHYLGLYGFDMHIDDDWVELAKQVEFLKSKLA